MSDCRRVCAEVLPDGRHPRERDANDVARETVDFLAMQIRAVSVALYIHPDGRVVRIVNPIAIDEDSCSLVGVYDESARAADIVADILEMDAA